MMKIEARFGDPWNADNPLGYNAILVADEQEVMLVHGEKMLDDYELNAEFVPVKYGGRLCRVDSLIRIMRTVYCYDPALGLGYGISSLIAAVNIWTAGNDEHCQEAAKLLLNNRKIACSYYEFSHGNDLLNVDFEAMSDGEDLFLNGSKHVAANIKLADVLVIFARDARENGNRNHSLIFVNKSRISSEQMKYLPRFNSAGMRGVQLGGVEFTNCRLTGDRILGTMGHGFETAIRSFQVTRTILSGVSVGIVDTGLRIVFRYGQERKLYGKNILELPYVRSVLANVFADLLICDCCSMVVARAIHLLPRESSLYASTIKFLLPKILIDAMNQLSMVLGAQSYLRTGKYAIFQKLWRDLKPSSFGHAGRIACQMAILPLLPRLAKSAWLKSETIRLPEVFKLDGDLPTLSFESLRITTGKFDPLMASLQEFITYESGNTSTEYKDIFDQATYFIDELKILQNLCRDIPPAELTVKASVESYNLTQRYALILAASICLNVWWHNKTQEDNFLNGSAWIKAALYRLRQQLDNQQSALPELIRENLLTELLQRYEHQHSFDLYNNPVCG